MITRPRVQDPMSCFFWVRGVLPFHWEGEGAPRFLFGFSEGRVLGNGNQGVALTDTMSRSLADPESDSAWFACVPRARVAVVGFGFGLSGPFILIVVAGGSSAGLSGVDPLCGDTLDSSLPDA